MKDLYKRLRIPSNATASQIEFALEHCEDDVLREDAEYILLNAARRTVYNRNYTALKLVGTLRNRLSLENTPFWGRDEFRDFTGTGVSPERHPPKRAAIQLPGWIENDAQRFFVVFAVLVLVYAFLMALFF